MCGEKSPLGPCGPVSPGSPPRMRGKGNLKIALVLGVGITPAHAGKRDSPRPDRPSAGGSPPHMRGKGVGAAFRAILGGITPAHAGKSKVMRGGKDKRMGSPPHMRGKGVNTGALPLYPWITPAHAGKRLFAVVACPALKDHPRTCGEKCVIVVPCSQLVGSPPHMRGKVRPFRDIHLCTGITPAHAGKSSGFGKMVKFSRDHPRTCGEKCHRPDIQVPAPGSPPHMRGKASVPIALPMFPRITPAHAGKRIRL